MEGEARRKRAQIDLPLTSLQHAGQYTAAVMGGGRIFWYTRASSGFRTGKNGEVEIKLHRVLPQLLLVSTHWRRSRHSLWVALRRSRV